MLMTTSVKEQTAQYFLLTPKLLQNLKYVKGVTILIVHHGEGVVNHREWNIDAFVKAGKRHAVRSIN